MSLEGFSRNISTGQHTTEIVVAEKMISLLLLPLMVSLMQDKVLMLKYNENLHALILTNWPLSGSWV